MLFCVGKNPGGITKFSLGGSGIGICGGLALNNGEFVDFRLGSKLELKVLV